MKLINCLLIWCWALIGIAQSVEYTAADSIRIEQLLKQAQREKPENVMMYFGKQFLGVPYVGHTLEEGDKEHLIINTRGLDCTTFVVGCSQTPTPW